MGGQKIELCGGNAKLEAHVHTSQLTRKLLFFIFLQEMDRYLSTMNRDSREQVFKRALFLMLVFCLQSGEMIRTHGREKRHGRSSIFGFSKKKLHGTTKAIRINTFKDTCERQAAFKKKEKRIFHCKIQLTQS